MIRVPLPQSDDGANFFEWLHQQSAAPPRRKYRDRLADRLGLSRESLEHLQVGWLTEAELKVQGTGCTGKGCAAFPMFNAVGAVCGIRLRSVAGHKYAVKGSKQGVFIPAGLSADGLLLIAEGPTDLAALLDCGFNAIARPSCRGQEGLIANFVKRNGFTRCVIVADADDPGCGGAEWLAMSLLPYCTSLRMITPPGGIKDVRAWRQAGATHEHIMQAIEEAPPLHLSVRAYPVRHCGRKEVKHA